MATDLPVEPRWILGIVAVVALAALMYVGTVPVEVGMTIMVSILAGLGVYERRGRRKLERQSRDGGG